MGFNRGCEMKYLLLILLFAGCAHNIPNGEYIIQVPAMQVIITDKHLPEGMFGMAHREWRDGKWWYSIFLRGNQTDKGLDFFRYICGHEYTHILHWVDPAIKDPHDDIIYKVFRGWWQ